MKHEFVNIVALTGAVENKYDNLLCNKAEKDVCAFNCTPFDGRSIKGANLLCAEDISVRCKCSDLQSRQVSKINKRISISNAIDVTYEVFKFKKILRNVLNNVAKSRPDEFKEFCRKIRPLFRDVFMTKCESPKALNDINIFFDNFLSGNLPCNQSSIVCDQFKHILRNAGAMAMFGIVNSVCRDVER